ncbi:hypothetical protein GJ744_009808 [Endocarpon pusillum]|uniref:Uncharacterized protein n=1 Tax=Endocarpon pusillum TaxID=364733 RepID=A0A8H7E8P6_9EURO|nr:hypothetical protein GJ744_009808 [Endocarpon pusillum]
MRIIRPDEEAVWKQYLRPGIEAPDLRPTVDSINTTAEWFFDYFQGLDKFCEHDLPYRLPASLEYDKHSLADPEAAKEVKRRLASYSKTLMRLGLR